MDKLRRATKLTVFLVLCATSSAAADQFRPLPASEEGAKSLQIRWIGYKGGTNGAMEVEVKNTGKAPQTFIADGLYFVPRGNPEKAPQRLGAAGPLQVVTKAGAASYVDKLELAPGESKRVALDVFCIDSHRSSPSSSTKFSVAGKRLPKKLRRELKSSNQAIYRKHGGYGRAAAKSEVQSNMWKVRDKDWVKLEGERAREKNPPRPTEQRTRPPLRQQRSNPHR